MDASFYAVLGVDADAEAATIRTAYREAVKEHHPDVSDAPDTVERFKRLTRARDVLLDPEERARYDRLGHETYVARHLDGPTLGRSDDAREPTAGPGQNHDQGESDTHQGQSDTRESGAPNDRGRSSTSSARSRARTAWSSETAGGSGASAGGVADPTPGARRHRAQEGRRRHVRAGPEAGRRPTDDPSVEEPWQTASAAYQRSAAASQAAADRTEGVSVVEVLSRVGPWIFVYAVLLGGATATAAFALLEADTTLRIAASLFGLLLLGSAIGLSTLHVVSRMASREDG